MWRGFIKFQPPCSNEICLWRSYAGCSYLGLYFCKRNGKIWGVSLFTDFFEKLRGSHTVFFVCHQTSFSKRIKFSVPTILSSSSYFSKMYVKRVLLERKWKETSNQKITQQSNKCFSAPFLCDLLSFYPEMRCAHDCNACSILVRRELTRLDIWQWLRTSSIPDLPITGWKLE